MKSLIGALLLVVVTGLAHAATTATVTPGPWDLYRGTSISSRGHASEAACVEAAKSLGIARDYTCRTRTGVSVKVTADPISVDCAGAWSEWTAGEWSACTNGSQSRQETRSFTVTTQPANGGKACPASPETRTATQSCTVDPPPPPVTAAHSVLENFDTTIRTGPEGNLWRIYQGGGSLSLTASCARYGAKGAQITGGTKPYFEFYPYNGGWRFAREYATNYQTGKYNRLGFWTKMTFPEQGGNNESVQFGTYTGNTGENSGQGRHFYHFLNTVPNVWTYVVIDANAQHLQSQPGSYEPDVYGATPSTYMDTLKRFYFEPEVAAPSGSVICFDEFTFFQVPEAEDIANIATLEASYNAASKKLHVGFQRNRSGDTTYTARWASTSFHVNGFQSGALCGTSGTDGQGDYTGKKIECTVDLAGLDAVYIAVQKSGRSDFRQVRLELN